MANNYKYMSVDKANSSVGSSMAQAVSRRLLTAKVRVSACGICGGQSGNGTGISPVSSVSPYKYH
jgi:hypothetical protein